MLYQTIYVSSAAGMPSQSVLDDILATSRHNNAADDISGLLLFHDGNFFQVLEGPEEKVVACYNRIRQDSRHTGCIVMLSGEIEARNFASWDMGFIPFADLDGNQQKSFIDIRDIGRSAKMQEAEQQKAVALMLNAFLLTLRRF